MGLFNHFPYTNFHELNLDWIVGKLKEFGAKIEEFQNVIDNIPTGESIGALRDEVARVEGKADANAQAIAGLPDEYPNPESLTFTGAASGVYDGSSPLTVNIPSGGGGGGEATELKTLTFTGASNATYNGTQDVTVNIPTSAPVGEASPLTFTGAVEAVYNGTSPVTVNIPSGGSGGSVVKIGSIFNKVGPVAVAAGEIAFDDNPSIPTDASKIIAYRLVWYGISTLPAYRFEETILPYYTGSTGEILLQCFGGGGTSLGFYQRSIRIDFENKKVVVGAGQSLNANGASSTSTQVAVPDALYVAYLE